MSLKKRYLKSKPICKVTFEVPKNAVDHAESVHLAGEFNEWSTESTPLTRRKTGHFNVTLDLETGREYQFRYLIDGHAWENEHEADRYVPSGFPGADNSVVVV
jgi:1,4-alpha-glucan branching enzyme